MKTRNAALAMWLAGYAAIVAGVLTLGGVPAAADNGDASVVLIALAGLAQILWGTYQVLRPDPHVEWIGVGVNAGTAAIAGLGAASASSGLGAVDVTRIGLSLAAMALAAYLLTRTTAASAVTGYHTPLRITALAVATGLVLAVVWVGAAALPVRFLAPVAEGGGASPTPTAHATAHPEQSGHQGTYLVRLVGAQAGPYIVQAFTGPKEVGDLFVEVSVRDVAGTVLENLTVSVEATAADDSGLSVGGSATTASAQVPGNYAVHLPVSTSGFWDVTLTIDGPEGQASVGFSERVGGTANVAGWVLAGVPLVVAVLFGLVYLRVAGRTPPPSAGH